ncbi:hypothetical protein [Roseovarius albus]|uniref:hypothetical protein n=1 Tax=Roseovarius albus TaxID=1247867 RepID=UPI000A2711FC|nr:hypothetical protein [Roseovarius albus]
MTAASPNTTLVQDAASALLRVQSILAISPKADVQQVATTPADAALYASGSSAQKVSFAKFRRHPDNLA